jgi:hypothetical protein
VACPLSDVQTNLDRPFTDRSLTTLYFEEQWHPKLWDAPTIGGLTLRHKASALEIKHFFSNARRMLGRHPQRMGRPQGSSEYSKDLFLSEATRIYFELWKKNKSRPIQEQVAFEMDLSISAFKYNWRESRVRWPPTRPMPD